MFLILRVIKKVKVTVFVFFLLRIKAVSNKRVN